MNRLMKRNVKVTGVMLTLVLVLIAGPVWAADSLVLSLDTWQPAASPTTQWGCLSGLNTPFTAVGDPTITTTFLLPRDPSHQRNLTTHLD